MNWLSKIFKSKKTKKSRAKKGDTSEIEVAQYEIELICLDPIPHLALTTLTITTFDLSVTQLRIDASETIEEDESGKEVKKQTPEIVFYLKIPSKVENSNLESISLNDAKLPEFHLLASKCNPIESEMVIAETDGTKYFKKLVYDLVLMPPETLRKLNMQYMEYRQEIEDIKSQSMQHEEDMRKTYKESLQKNEKSNLQKEEWLRTTLDKLNSENLELAINIPAKRNELIKGVIKKMNVI